eukprot:CAMPEP_0185759912 /NCGR_PEP_ID=MMETSP1174-20130828/18715_1 /TAXON_ID=35687 /ORGANISM="Dictyocha speculum, Strain CCMP1381" /LENGTH=420 /DNA_ID=CAMNT_0028440483 /DNA_START=89 /DNA_END=1351 /DNA_ORIENTATION=+
MTSDPSPLHRCFLLFELLQHQQFSESPQPPKTDLCMIKLQAKFKTPAAKVKALKGAAALSAYAVVGGMGTFNDQTLTKHMFDQYHGMQARDGDESMAIIGQATNLYEGEGEPWESVMVAEGGEFKINPVLGLGDLRKGKEICLSRLTSATLTNDMNKVQGRTLLSVARQTLKAVKKMSALWRQYLDPTGNFPSGKNHDDALKYVCDEFRKQIKNPDKSNDPSSGDDDDDDDGTMPSEFMNAKISFMVHGEYAVCANWRRSVSDLLLGDQDPVEKKAMSQKKQRTSKRKQDDVYRHNGATIDLSGPCGNGECRGLTSSSQIRLQELAQQARDSALVSLQLLNNTLEGDIKNQHDLIMMLRDCGEDCKEELMNFRSLLEKKRKLTSKVEEAVVERNEVSCRIRQVDSGPAEVQVLETREESA